MALLNHMSSTAHLESSGPRYQPICKSSSGRARGKGKGYLENITVEVIAEVYGYRVWPRPEAVNKVVYNRLEQ